MKKEFKMGDEVKDKITGFQGIITGHAKYFTGCDQFIIQPKCDKPGTYPEANWFDEGRVEFVKTEMTEKDVESEKNGCDYTAPIK